ncbi:chloride intracellular channel exl-1 [Anabrus simplex]|uniref:chloride intracellular channel exl-1 n=1 Tax=Anabrus simplex TaxID=316456 RepID=UPI0035A2FFCC
MTEQKNVTLFVKAGRDGCCLGACPQSQRVLMLAELKVAAGILSHFEKVPVNVARPPEVFKSLGLRLRVPALYLGCEDEEPIDVADDIVAMLESCYPGGVSPLSEEVSDAELATRDFFSRFCFFIRDVSKDPGQLEAELRRIDEYLSSSGSGFLCGNKPSLLDCEVLPKLHQVRVAAAGIKGYQIPSDLSSLWRYLHAAYSEPAFLHSCPSDVEILLHWLEHIGESPSNLRKQQLQALHEKSPQYSFTVPVFAKPVMLE